MGIGSLKCYYMGRHKSISEWIQWIGFDQVDKQKIKEKEMNWNISKGNKITISTGKKDND